MQKHIRSFNSCFMASNKTDSQQMNMGEELLYRAKRYMTRHWQNCPTFWEIGMMQILSFNIVKEGIAGAIKKQKKVLRLERWCINIKPIGNIKESTNYLNKQKN